MSDPQCSPVPTHTYHYACVEKGKPARQKREMCREVEFSEPEKTEEVCKISLPLRVATCKTVAVPATKTAKVFKLDFYVAETEDEARARLQKEIDAYAKSHNLKYIKAYYCD